MPSRGNVRSKGRLGKKTIKAIEPALIPMCELFASVDDVFTEPEAFSKENIHKSLGRCYRAWLKARTDLDPEFDPERYRQKIKKRKAVRTGLSVPPASTSQRSSTGRTSISEKSQKQSAKSVRESVKPSARRAKSNGRASNGR